jgi:hypothetical protein
MSISDNYSINFIIFFVLIYFLHKTIKVMFGDILEIYTYENKILIRNIKYKFNLLGYKSYINYDITDSVEKLKINILKSELPLQPNKIEIFNKDDKKSLVLFKTRDVNSFYKYYIKIKKTFNLETPKL